MAPLVDFGALTVVYYQYGMKNAHEAPWDFSMPYELHFKRKWILTITGALAGASLFLIFDMVYNGKMCIRDRYYIAGQLPAGYGYS